MGEKVKLFFKWVGNNIAWEFVRAVAIYLAKAAFSLAGGEVLLQKMPRVAMNINAFLVSLGVSASNYIIPLSLVSFFIYGVVSFISPPINWFITYIIRSDKPRFVQDNEWNQIIDYEGKKDRNWYDFHQE